MKILRKRLQSGFTLIELLVVIAIIAILLSFLLPSLKSALNASRGISCANNQHQLFMQGVIYADDNNNYWPPHGMKGYDWYIWLFRYNPATGIGIENWLQRIHISPEIVRCAADETEQPVSFMCNAMTYPRVVPGVAMSNNITNPANLISLRYPGSGNISKIPWLVDRTRILGGYTTISNVKAATAFRHNDQSNIVFFDGHVSSSFDPLIWYILYYDRNQWVK